MYTDIHITFKNKINNYKVFYHRYESTLLPIYVYFYTNNVLFILLILFAYTGCHTITM